MNQPYESSEPVDYQMEQPQEESSGGGVSRALLYIGGLVVVNIILLAVDAPFYIY
jgi:hypothetical protein